MTEKKKHGKAYVGTSGWSYDDWAGRFYPADIRKKDWFGYFAAHFSTVELNATYYRLFPAKTFGGWKDKAPKNFTYAVKMWGLVTHRKRLKDVTEQTQTVLERAAMLGRHLGPVLIQLPPGLHREDQRLADYIEVLKETRQKVGRRFRFTIEFRHESWMDDAVFAMLKKSNIALCLPDGPRMDCPKIVTSYFTYVRFHGREGKYQTIYSQKMLAEWADWMKKQIENGIDVCAYFNNDFHAHAVQNARQLIDLVEK